MDKQIYKKDTKEIVAIFTENGDIVINKEYDIKYSDKVFGDGERIYITEKDNILKFKTKKEKK